jgi:hypothetical protein
MSNNAFRVQEQDRARINVNDHYDIAHWTARFSVSEQQLRDAVERVGVMADVVERELKNALRTSPSKKRA